MNKLLLLSSFACCYQSLCAEDSLLHQYVNWLASSHSYYMSSSVTLEATGTAAPPIHKWDFKAIWSEKSNKYLIDYSLKGTPFSGANKYWCFDGEKNYILNKDNGKAVAYSERTTEMAVVCNPLILPVREIFSYAILDEKSQKVSHETIFDLVSDFHQLKKLMDLKPISSTNANGQVSEEYKVKDEIFKFTWANAETKPVPVHFSSKFLTNGAPIRGELTWNGEKLATCTLVAGDGSEKLNVQLTYAIQKDVWNNDAAVPPIVFDMALASEVFDFQTKMTIEK